MKATMLSYRAKVLLAVALVATPSVRGHAATTGQKCQPAGRFLLDAPVLQGPLGTGTKDAVVIGDDFSILSGCPDSALKTKKVGVKRNFTRVIAVWKNCGDAKQVHLDAKIHTPDCDSFDGRIVVRQAGSKPRATSISAALSTCGDGVFDPGGEACDAGQGCDGRQCADDCTCGGPGGTTSTSTSTSTSSSSLPTSTSTSASSSSLPTSTSVSTSTSSSTSTLVSTSSSTSSSSSVTVSTTSSSSTSSSVSTTVSTTSSSSTTSVTTPESTSTSTSSSSSTTSASSSSSSTTIATTSSTSSSSSSSSSSTTSTSTSSSTSTSGSGQTCGNGTREGTEECDDGNDENTDACTNHCLNARCGDQIVRTGVEQCDDGNDIPNDGCTNCVNDPPVCGNGLVQAGETCDDGNTVDGDSCPSNCRIEPCTATATRVGITVTLNYPNTIKICTAPANPTGDCSAAPFPGNCQCSANGDCQSNACNPTSVGTVAAFLNYPDGRVSIPGSASEASVVARITNTPAGFTSAVNDLDYALREAVVGFNRTLAKGTLFKASFDLCSGATTPTKNDFTCTIEQARSAGNVKLSTDGFSCAVTIP